MWELDCEESWALKNWCFWTVVLEKTLEGPLDCKEIQPVHSRGDRSWVFFGRNDAKAETPVLWPFHVKSWLMKRLWCWEGLGAGGEGDDRGWDGWVASPIWWTWVCVNSGSWWWTGRPGVLQFMGSQRIGHGWVTELKGYEEMIDYFADLWKDDMIVKLRYPETHSLKYLGVWCWAQIELMINLLLGKGTQKEWGCSMSKDWKMSWHVWGQEGRLVWRKYYLGR